MSTQVLGEMLVRYTANISDLTAKVKTVKSDLASAANAAQSSGSGMFSGFQKGISGALQFGAQIGQTVFGMQALAQGAISLGSALLEPNASMEQTQVGFETLLGKGKATFSFMKDLQQFAAATPFTFPELATDAQHMLAFGFSARDVIPDLTDIGDAMGAMGKGTADIDAVVRVFGQMKAAGKANAGDMMQLADQGIPAWKFLAQAMHLSVAQVQDLSQKGLIPADVAIRAMTTGMHKMFGGGMAAQANTFNGLLSTLQDNAGAAMRAFTGPLFDKAKQGLTALGNLVSSKSFQDFATNVGGKLGTAFTTISNVIGTVAGGIGQFVGWLKQGSAPAVAVGIALAMIAGGFAAIQIGAFIAAIPALVAGFIAWGVAAWSAAIATIAATWPLLAIGAAVVLVVALIVLAVQHWGQITKWLGDVWKGFSSWFMGLLSTIGTFFVSLWNGVINWLKGVWSGLVSWFAGMMARLAGVFTVLKVILAIVFAPLILAIGLIVAPIVGLILLITHFGQVWNFIKGAIAAFWRWLTGIVQSAIHTVVGWFLWLYNHNTYFQMLVDRIRAIVSAVLSWLRTAWTVAIAFIVGIWQRLVAETSAIWTVLTGTIRGVVNTIVTWLHSIWDGITGWIVSKWNWLSAEASAIWTVLTSMIRRVVDAIVGWLRGIWDTAIKNLHNNWNKLSGLAKDAWDKVTGVFQSAWGMISKPLADLWSNISKWFTDLGKGASDAGTNFINMLVSGIKNGAGAVWDAVSGIASNIWKALGFHSPAKEGPGRTADKWMPSLIDMLASGLMTGVPKIQRAANQVAAPLAQIVYPIRPSASAIAYAAGSGAGVSGGQTVILEVDSVQLARITNRATDKLVRLKMAGAGRAA